MTDLRFLPVSLLRVAFDDAIARHSLLIHRLLPTAEIEEIGASAVPGLITKGDLDLLVRVDAHEFDDAVVALRRIYEVHQLENWTSCYASFTGAGNQAVPVGVRLVAAGSPPDTEFVSFREALRQRIDLVERLNELKREHEGGDPTVYGAAKGAFVERVLRETVRGTS